MSQTKSKHQGGREWDLSYPLFYGFWIVLNLMMAFRIRELGTGMWDFVSHNRVGVEILDNGFDLSNLYHNGVAFIMMIFGVESNYAGAIVVFIMRMAFIASIHYFASRLLRDYVQPKWILFTIAVSSLAASIPNLFGRRIMYYHGHGINVWHNPTTFTVMPFAILSFFFFCYVLELSDIDKKDRVRAYWKFKLDSYYVGCFCLALTLFLSVYGKLSWLPPFSMAALIFFFIWWASSKFSVKRLYKCIHIGLCFIPAALLAFWIRTNSVYNVVEFAFAINPMLRPYPLILNMLFPIFVVALCYKTIITNRFCQIAWMTYIAALLQYVFIIQPDRVRSGNTGWGYLYALTLLLMVSLITFIKYIHEQHPSAKSKRLKWTAPVGLCLASIHLFSGIYYALRIYSGSSFFF